MRAADKAHRAYGQRIGFSVASGAVEAHLIRIGRRKPYAPLHPFLPGAGPTVAPVRVYAPDGTLREEVPAQEWRRRHGNPFRRKRSQEEDG